MLITLDNYEWTELSDLTEGSTYALQIVEPSNAYIQYAAESPSDNRDAIKIGIDAYIKFKYNGSQVIKAADGSLMGLGSVSVTAQEVA